MALTGRPKKGDAGGRRHIGFQAPAHLRAQLEAAAEENQRSISAETIARLERSFDPILPDEDRGLMFALYGAYKHGGDGALLRQILLHLETDPAKRELRRKEMLSRLQGMDPDNVLESGIVIEEEANRPLPDVLEEKMAQQIETAPLLKKPARRRAR